MINKTLAMCGTTEKPEAQTIKAELETLQTSLNNNTILSVAEKQTLNEQITKEITQMEKVLAMTGTTSREILGEDVQNI
jgi:lambda repressor-like predicted transcriptional regulator